MKISASTICWACDDRYSALRKAAEAGFEAVEMIKGAGGVACCAHPAKIKNDKLLEELIFHGMCAIEVYHPDHGRAGARFYRKFAQKHSLIVTGGSDSHCLDSAHYMKVGEICIDCSSVEELRKASGW